MLATSALAQEQTIDAAEVIDSANQFLQENIDQSILDSLGVDADRTRQFFNQLHQHFQGADVYDLAALRETATQLVPLLQQFEETEPYAIWLKSRLDYFQVADQLRRNASRGSTNTAARLPQPTAKMERKAWIEVVQERPMPDLASKQVLPLKKIFIAERVPPELVWLAEVESSFNAKAKSPAGAAGLFQLMPITARSLNLSVGLLRDERLHPEKNARAAARYLATLYKRFGNWRLALAAYNAGEGRVAELLRKNKARTFDEIAHRLPAETQLYVPKLEALVQKREGRALADLKIPKG